MTQIDEMFVQIAKFVLNRTDFSFTRAQSMIKQHTEKLSQRGDIGFPTTLQPWLNIVDNPKELKDLKQIINGNEDEFARKLMKISENWVFPIQSVQFKQFRCLLFLDRVKCFGGILRTVLFDDATYGQWCDDTKRIYAIHLVEQPNEKSLIEHRCMLVAKALNNMLRTSGIETVLKANESARNAADLMDIYVTCARRDGARRVNRENAIECNNMENNNNNNNNNAKWTSIVCGSVSSRSGHTTDDYIRLRSLEMEKMAESKHGPIKDSDVIEKCQQLGAAIVTYDLLKVKHFNAIDFEKLMSAPSGAAFILYNTARLQTLLASFDHHVQSGYYDTLPAFDDIDFSLLKEEEEWQMLFVYIVGFPSMLERCVSGIENGQIAIHLLCNFLSNLSALFSLYYHRIKILTENMPHLMPVLHARIYFLKALRVIFFKCLSILEIEPLDQM